MKDHPVRIEGSLDPTVSRGLWLIKWLLALPHYVLLAFLWLAMAVVSVVAFFAILFTGRYPRSLFGFTSGVLRWSWRVGFYAYSALGTDRYPPFTLADVPDYPARLHVEYPERLHRGLIFLKWLLAFPHLLVVAVLVGGGPFLSYRVNDSVVSLEGGGLVGLLVLISGVVLLFRGRYPKDLFDLVIGLNRWVYRVAGYVLLLTDEYPPFRLDTGPGCPDRSPEGPPAYAVAEGTPPAASAPPASAPPTPAATGRWTAGRVVSVVLGSILLVAGLGMAPAGAAGLWYDRTARDTSGYLGTSTERFTSSGYAISTATMHFDGPDWVNRVLGDVRITAESTNGVPLFVGIAPQHDVLAYLDGVEHTVLHEFGTRGDRTADELSGHAPATLPGEETFWTTHAAGNGELVVDWAPRAGDWTAVVLSADGSRGVQADLSAAATFPWLDDAAIVLLASGLVLLLVGAVLVAVATHRHQNH